MYDTWVRRSWQVPSPRVSESGDVHAFDPACTQPVGVDTHREGADEDLDLFYISQNIYAMAYH